MTFLYVCACTCALDHVRFVHMSLFIHTGVHIVHVSLFIYTGVHVYKFACINGSRLSMHVRTSENIDPVTSTAQVLACVLMSDWSVRVRVHAYACESCIYVCMYIRNMQIRTVQMKYTKAHRPIDRMHTACTHTHGCGRTHMMPSNTYISHTQEHGFRANRVLRRPGRRASAGTQAHSE